MFKGFKVVFQILSLAWFLNNHALAFDLCSTPLRWLALKKRPAIFSIVDFPESELKPISGAIKNSSYSEWASREASLAVEEFQNNTHPERILDSIAKSRRRLEKSLRKRGPRDRFVLASNPYKFGNWRTGRTHPSSGFSKLHSQQRGNLKIELMKLFRIYLAGGGSQDDSTRQNFYLSTDGSLLPSGLIEIVHFGAVSGDVFGMHHPEEAEWKPIIEDVWKRLENLRHLPSNSERAKQEFALAVYGYYQAMPFERGSSAIGRSFFAAAGYFYFGKKMPQPDGIDVRAMIMPYQDFLDWYLPLFP